MILTCAECRARYLIPEHSLIPNGRTVRCGNCGHTWYVSPPADDGAGAADGDADGSGSNSFADMVANATDSIPQGVRPIPEGSSVPAHIGARADTGFVARIGGYAVAAVLFVAVAGGLFAMRDTVVQSWPASLAVYNMVGFAPEGPLADIVFDRVDAKTSYNEDGVEVLTVSGKIINLRARSVELAPIRVSARMATDGAVWDWVIDPPAVRIGPEETLEFTAAYADIPADAQEINVRFTLDEQ